MTRSTRAERATKTSGPRLEAKLAALDFPPIPEQPPTPHRPPPVPPARCALADTPTVQDTILELLPDHERIGRAWRVLADPAATIAAERIHAHDQRRARDARQDALGREAVAGLMGELIPPDRSEQL
ncbi:hypothetical protein [Arthrobacter sp. H20]|uniref:hypothetical protein n=1 Tax=Arthrobacter sp. H20 TaxID=1267981 RepID=UPI00047BE834|nr:hypothetical protein [Arthrobacter sp. H20]